MITKKRLSIVLGGLSVVALWGGLWSGKSESSQVQTREAQPVYEARTSRFEVVNKADIRPSAQSLDANGGAQPKTGSILPLDTIGDFWSIVEKALPSTQDRQRYNDLLQSPQMLAKAKADLLFTFESDATKVPFKTRLKQLKFLEQAIQWSENPQRKMAIASARDIVLADTLGDDQPRPLRRSRASTKIELFALLLEKAPKTAREIQEKATASEDAQLIRVLEFATDYAG